MAQGYSRKAGSSRKEGKLNDKLQQEIKAEYEIRKRFSEQLPNEFVDEEETLGPQPEPEKPKPGFDKFFNQVHRLLLTDVFLEDYFMLLGKHKDRIMIFVIEIPVDVVEPKATTADTHDYNSLRCASSEVSRALRQPYS